MPEALYADLADDAERRGTSLNHEVLRRCVSKRWPNQADYSRRQQATIQPLNGSLPFD